MFQSKVEKSSAQLRSIAVPLALVLVMLGVLSALTAPGFVPRYYVLHEDGFVLAALVCLLLGFSAARSSIAERARPHRGLSTRTVVIGAALAAILLWAGTYFLFDNYPLSRDEHMAVFDMQIFRTGRLAAPVPAEWRGYAAALTPAFLLTLPGNAAWASSYMPVNAMLRTLFGAILDPASMNPVLAAVGAVATFDCSRRLFPDQRGAQSISLLMYATSAQVLVTAMTPYAMTGHLALNMIWLWFYLRDTRKGHAAAMATGFLAIGLHQVIFHPLFALPFIDHLRRRGEWRTALAYIFCYALFGLFWISYPHIVALSAGIGGQSGSIAGSGGFIAQRVLPLLADRDPQTIPLMEANIVRFVTWQNLALAPLMILGWGAVRRKDGLAGPLAEGVILTFIAMTILLPYQGIGWGYRYLHGLIGSCALLAAYGWRDCSDHLEVRAFVRAATIVTIFGSVPFLAWQAETFIRPYARVNRMIDNINADMVVVSTIGPVFRIDEVRNRPDLTNRPLRLAGNLLKPADIAILCRRGSLAFVDAGQMQALGVGFGIMPDPKHFRELREAAIDHCGYKG